MTVLLVIAIALVVLALVLSTTSIAVLSTPWLLWVALTLLIIVILLGLSHDSRR